MNPTTQHDPRAKSRRGRPFFNVTAKRKTVLSLLFLLFSFIGRAADFPVTNTNDAGPGSLRQAIIDVNAAAAGSHNIKFLVYGQITLLSSFPQITKPVTIDGENRITLNSNGTNVVVNPFDIRANNVVIRNFKLTNAGDIYFIVRANTTGVLIENMNTSSNNGNWLNALVYVEGNSTGLTLRNMRCNDIEPAGGAFNGRAINFAGGMHTNLVMDNIHLSSLNNARGGEGIVFRDASVNGWTFTNSTVRGFLNGIVLDNTGGAVETANNIELDNVVVDSLYGGASLGFYSDFVNTNIRLKNTVIDLNLVTSTNDGDYAIRFDNSTKDILLQNVTVKDGDLQSVWFNGTSQNITIDGLKVSDPTPGDGYAGQFLRFEGVANTITIRNSVFDADKLNTADDADYGILFMAATTGVTIDNCRINEFDTDGIHVVGASTNFQVTNCQFTNNLDGIEFYNNVPRTNVDIINSAFKGSTRSGIVINAANAVSDIDLTGDTVINSANHGVWFYGGAGVTDAQVTGCVFRNNGGAGINNESPNKVIITNNSIFNNKGAGISLPGGNCTYTNAAGRTPVLLASGNMGGGQYQLQITIPNITAGAVYTVDIYANDPASSKTSGQYFVTSLTGLSAGTAIHTINYNTGPGVTGTGFWTATLRIPANNCGTSEFSNSLPMGIKAPACITNGIVGWYRADMGINVNIWGDISGNANHLNVIGDPDTAASFVNFNPAFYYDGNDAHTAPASAAVTNAYTIMGLGKLEGTQNGRLFASTTGNKLLGWHGGRDQGYHNEAWLKNSVVITNNTRLYSVKRTNTGGGPYEFKGNGVLLGSGTASNGSVWTLDVGASVYGEYTKGFVPEVFIYNRPLTPVEIQKLESYMGLKYGITLNNGLTDYIASDGTTFMWAAATNTGYNFRITGIGKDDCTMLHQKQSLSADTGTITMALGNAIMLSNAANTNAVTTDKTFLVFGDNNASMKMTTAVTGTNVNQRMARVWKVQKSAAWSDQDITLKIKGAASNNYLIISTSNTFGTVSQELQLDANGQVTFNSSLLANGAYFTLASTIKGPANVNAGVALWLRADDGTATGAAWNDASGNANGAVQAAAEKTATVLPSNINFNPALKFDGVNDNLSSPSIFTGTGVNNAQVYAVTITDAIQAQSIYGELLASGQQILSHLPWSDNIMYFDAPYGYRAQGAWGGTLGTPYLWSFLRTPATMSGNRNRVTVGTYTAAMSNIAGNNNPFWVGSNNSGNPFNGKIAELIVYNNAAATTVTQRQQIESYLALKYGLTLSPATPVDYLASDASKFWDATVNTGYNRNIAGLGKDNVSSLHQKQSVSTDDKFLTIALGNSIAASNAANTATISNDLSFFVTGDNNGAKLYNVNLTGIAGVNVAMARTWKVQKTNWTDQDITFRTDTNSTAPRFLIISTDAAFGTGDIALPLTNGMITLNTSQLPNGAFFTFANALKGPGGVTNGIGAWYKGDFGLKSSVWNDFSGNGFNIPQPTVANQPGIIANGVNFNPTASFTPPQYFGLGNAVDPATSVFGNVIPQNVGIFGVSIASAGASGGGIFSQLTTNNNPVVAAPSNSNTTTYWDAPNGFRVSTPFTGPLEKQHLWSFTKTTTNMSVFKDRTQLINSNTAYVYNGTGGNYASNIGVWHGNGYFFGKIPEVIVYKDITTLTATDKLKIESYLAIKYGVTMNLTGVTGYTATDGTVYYDAAANTGFLRHITGIGRDELTELNQKQSLSADTGNVTLALGNSVAVSNALNTSVVTNDRSFFMIGDDGATTAYTTPISGQAGLSHRMTRIFKIDKTNWADQNITFKLKGGNAQTYLLLSNDAVFDGADTKLVMNADSTITINTSTLADGSFFTFATALRGPNAITNGIMVWLRADDKISNGVQWNDFSRFGTGATQPVNALSPTLDAKGINFNYSMKFDGVDDFMDNATDTLLRSNNATLIAVVDQLAYTTWGGVFTYNRSSNTERPVITNSDINNRIGANHVNISAVQASVNTPAPGFLIRTLFDATSVSATTNGGTLTNSISPSWPGTGTILGYHVGRHNTANYFNGHIAEVIAYNRPLTAPELLRVESYLGIKYGLTLNSGASNYLSSDNTVYWTANATFKNRVTGIGRDDSTALSTKQSLSVDTGLVTISLGNSIPVTNEINTGTFGNDRSFFVFADNGLAGNNFTVQVTGSAHNVTRRMARVWRVQKTNWADQNITLKIKPFGIDNYLLVSSDPTFATLAQELPLNADGTITLSSSSFTNTDIYFTFGGPLKSPGGVPGHTLWVRPDIGTSSVDNNTAIDEWTDMSAMGNSALQPTAANQPLFMNNFADNMNFNPVVKFNGTTHFMNLDITKLPMGTTARTLMAVGAPNAIAGNKYILSWGVAATNQGMGLAMADGANARGYIVGYGNDIYTNPAFFQLNRINELSATWAGAGGAAALYSKMVNVGAVGMGNKAWNTTGTIARIGNSAWAAEYWSGPSGDIIVYPYALNAGQRLKVSSYLALKYGYTIDQTTANNYLATDSTVIWNAATNAGYDKNIAGIGRDDEEALVQKQSRSTNTGVQVTVGLGSIDSTNMANPNAYNTDRSYLIWGDNNGVSNFSTPFNFNGVNYRMGRVWKVQETGTVGNVMISIPASIIPDPSVSYLVVSNDATFDGADQFIQLTAHTINNVQHWAASVDLTDAQYFTFADFVKSPGGVTGTTQWFRADFGTDATTDNTPNTEWKDFTYNVNSVTQTAAANQPKYMNNLTDNMNFNPVLLFDGVNDYYDLNSNLNPASVNPHSNFIVYKPYVLNRGLYGNDNNAFDLGQFTQMVLGNEALVNYPGGNSLRVPVINESYYMHSTAADSRVFTNYKQQLAFVYWGANGGDATTYLGANGINCAGCNSFFSGPMGEYIRYNKALTATERLRVNTYLSLKYGVSIDQTTPNNYLATDGTTAVWDATVNSVYKYSVTGIGRDDVEGLVQKQSRNSDTTRLSLAIGLGALAESNPDNTGTFSTDINYMIWGDDNGALSFKTPVTGNPDVNYRMLRTWKVQETGTVGEVEVAVPFDALPNPRQSFLVISNDAVFDNTDTYIPLYDIMLNGKKHWAAKVNFTTNQYFTVAAFIKSPGGVGITSLWMRADQGIQNPTDGTPVDTWIDFGNEVNNASQATAASQPVFNNNTTSNINYNPVVSFNGTSHQMNLDVTKLPTGNAARTLYGVGTPTLINGNRYLIGYGTGATNNGSGLLNSAGSGLFTGYGNEIIAAAQWQANVLNEMSGTFAGAGGLAALYSKMLPVATAANRAWVTGTGGARIGNSPWGSEFWSGPITEVIAFDRALSNTERQRVTTYLAIRNGYTMDQTTPYRDYLSTTSAVVWDGTVNATYNRNIAGIGRDDIEGLYQKQAKSIHTGSILAVGLGNIETDNPTNTNTFSSNESYMLWGSNSNALTVAATDLPALYTQRLTQEWKLSLSNFNNQLQPVALEFDLTGVTHKGQALSDFTLLVDNDGDGDFTTGTVSTIAASDYTGNKLRFNSVTTLSHNAVVTVAFGPRSLRLNAKAILQGAWNGTAMGTGLKSSAVLPTTDPYGLNTTPTVAPNAAAAQVVDWVQVELRDPANPSVVVDTRAAFILSNGNIVDTTYTQPLTFYNAFETNYNVAIRHRNHLGVMSLNAVDFSTGTGVIDFTLSATATYGTHARKDLGAGVMGLWAGDVNADRTIRHSAAPSDATLVSNAVLSHAGNTSASPLFTGFTTTYSFFDVNLDGRVYYTATPSDYSIIINNVKTHPGNSFGLTSFIIREQLP